MSMTLITSNEPAVQLKGRDFLSLSDYSPEELHYLLHLAKDLKQKQKSGIPHQKLLGKSLGMIFEKSSTRTRVSFEVGMFQLGGQALFLSKNDIQLGRGETIHDTAQTLSRYIDGIMIRTFEHSKVIDLARGATIPVINGLTDSSHPCQSLTDYMTVLEHKGKLAGLKIAYIGDGNNMVHSLLIGAAKFSMQAAVASPEGYMPDKQVIQTAKEVASQTGGSILITQEPKEAIAEADIVYTDVWASMGFEEEQAARERAFVNYQVNEELVQFAKPDYLFMHCLPAHRGEEVSAEIIDGKHSIVFDQAEKRLHAQKAVMLALMG